MNVIYGSILLQKLTEVKEVSPKFPEKNYHLTNKEKSETDLVESPVRFDTWALFVTGFDPAETVKFEDDEVGNFIFLLQNWQSFKSAEFNS